MWQLLFGAKAQVVVGVLMLLATGVQTAYWLVITPPTVLALFLVSMEALAFAGYAVVATGLGFRATERVESVVADTADVEHADEVNVEAA